MQTKQLNGEPGGLSTLLRAALPVLPVVNQLPGVKKSPARDFSGLSYTRTGVKATRAGAEAYAAVCGFPRKDTLPLPYPHLLAFPLHMAIMSDADVPVRRHRHGPPGEHHHRAPGDRGRRGPRPDHVGGPARARTPRVHCSTS